MAKFNIRSWPAVLVVMLVWWQLVSAPSTAAVTNDSLASVDLGELRIHRGTGLRMHQGQPFSGIAIQRYSNRQLAKLEQFVKGRRHGQVKRWFENGSLAFSSQYQHGRREGVSISWWNNGNKRSVTHYVSDKPHGQAKQWYRQGQLFKRMNYVEGKPVGLQQGWRKNGKLFSNYEYRNGRTYGLKNANLCVELEDEQLVVGK